MKRIAALFSVAYVASIIALTITAVAAPMSVGQDDYLIVYIEPKDNESKQEETVTGKKSKDPLGAGPKTDREKMALYMLLLGLTLDAPPMSQ